MIKRIILVAASIFLLYQCTEDKSYKDAQNIALTQYVFSCTGGSIQSCKLSCDGKCGIDSTSITSSKIDCVNICTEDCNRNCNTILLFLFNTKD
ncbi:MAG: hypothetical protein KBA66_24025 [Leptospiraceae bacterium]|nr:hypothetical protein [Leptospiraceae bacterium]